MRHCFQIGIREESGRLWAVDDGTLSPNLESGGVVRKLNLVSPKINLLLLFLITLYCITSQNQPK